MTNSLNNRRFISFEGGEGLGKTTQIQLLATSLRNEGQIVCLTREPGGTNLGESLRKLLLGSNNACLETELLLMFAARAQHIHECIKPQLELGHWVLCDRFIDSSYAYQGAGRGLAESTIQGLDKIVCKDLMPGRTYLFDALPELGRHRIQKRLILDHFELEDAAFYQRVRLGFLERFKLYPERIKLLNANKTKLALQAEIWQDIKHCAS